jgi:hypothetical protein
MSTWFYGLHYLAEVGAAEMDAYIPVTPELRETVVKILTEYLEGKLTYNFARDQIIKLIGRDEPIIKVTEIKNLPEIPLPPYTGSNETSPISYRRKTHTWSSAEDLRLIAGVARYGLDNWQAVAQFLGSSRNRAQCSQRWIRCLDPNISKKPWTPEEDARLLEIVKIHGEKSWTKVAALLGGRSDVQCRYHYKHLPMNSSSPELETQAETKSHVNLESSHKLSSTSNLLATPTTQFPKSSQPQHVANQAPLEKPFNPRVHSPSYLSINEGKQFGSIPIFNPTRDVLKTLPFPYYVCVGSDSQSLDLFLSQFTNS